MKTGRICNIFFVCFLILFLQADLCAVFGESSGLDSVREPILAGTWYPEKKDSLSQSVKSYLSKVMLPQKRDIKGIIVPHAGHIYSGQVAAYAYKNLEQMDIKTVVMVGPSHRFPFRGVSVNLQDAYKTPLGMVPVDRELAKKLIKADDYISYVPEAHAQEHSLEIQLPFLQSILTGFKIVPIVMGDQDFKACSRLADILAKQIKNGSGKTVLLASSDLSHYHGDNLARELDRKLIQYVDAFDPEGLSEALGSGMCEACGGGPMCTVMLVSKALGADNAKVLNYANSGDVTADNKRVVGYMSAILFKGN